MIIGILFCVAGLIHGVFKYFVIRSAARDVYNGGGIPVMVFVSLWLAYGSMSLLRHAHVYPFPYFGVVAYFALAVVLYALMQFEYHRGKPEVERQLKNIEAASRNQTGNTANDHPETKGGSSEISGEPSTAML